MPAVAGRAVPIGVPVSAKHGGARVVDGGQLVADAGTFAKKRSAPAVRPYTLYEAAPGIDVHAMLLKFVALNVALPFAIVASFDPSVSP